MKLSCALIPVCAIFAHEALDVIVRLAHIDEMGKALEPANSIIDRFGGPDNVREITGASRTRVYRWTQPKSEGGTDGLIPTPQVVKLLSHARSNGMPLTADDFLPPTTMVRASA